ncbi:MAG: hypothetical protein ACJAWS_003300 [Oleiphilaceae bacterium]|jgi:hypothetical protein
MLAFDTNNTIPDSIRTLEYIDHTHPNTPKIYASDAEKQAN